MFLKNCNKFLLRGRNIIIIISFLDSIILWYKHNNHVDFVIDSLMNLSLVLLIIICNPISNRRFFALLFIYLLIIFRFLLLIFKFIG
ncbi:hypothetical protein C0030_002955 [Candidatus Liberibacter solanacearum]|uniref:Uncharacterized protein n=1 Tax=Candidatus Liberibacter solanacearum TaxID=556287 RepID=A0A1V2N9H4_9HYPH|nr:hypothetical protein AYJ09_00675 [Candidatus Liberibacter solanacearum]ONI60323.1 hypothetical protein AYO25_00455 [Candidatus Liberibacter solanacearum]RPD37284.1 hypothetical protein C0030_002955 [Candidatus Liberibacter solanacearum]